MGQYTGRDDQPGRSVDIVTAQTHQLLVEVDDGVGHVDQQAEDGAWIALDQVGELLTSNFITGTEQIQIDVPAAGVYTFEARWNVLGGDEQSTQFSIEFIPEPASLVMLGAGGLVLRVRRRNA